MSLAVKNLQVKVKNKLILKGVDLTVKEGETVALMGPNGSGKSSLAYTLIGLPNYQIIGGKMGLDKKDLLEMKPDERAKAGLFLAWQQPVSVRGVSYEQMLRRAAINCRCLRLADFKKELNTEATKLKINPKLLSGEINVGLSGGEKKKLELLQLAVLRPNYALLDEIDSGLDIDALQLAARRIKGLKQDNPKMGLVLITHYSRLLQLIKPDRVAVMINGSIVKLGSRSLIQQIEKNGYDSFK